MSINRTWPLRFLSLLILLAVVMYGCTPTKKSVVGTYKSDSDNGAVVVEVRSDGTYIQYNGSQQIGSGRWHLEVADHIFRSLELDNSYRLPVTDKDVHFGKGAMSYQLVHRGGKLCLDVDQDLIVWCKVK